MDGRLLTFLLQLVGLLVGRILGFPSFVSAVAVAHASSALTTIISSHPHPHPISLLYGTDFWQTLVVYSGPGVHTYVDVARPGNVLLATLAAYLPHPSARTRQSRIGPHTFLIVNWYISPYSRPLPHPSSRFDSRSLARLLTTRAGIVYIPLHYT